MLFVFRPNQIIAPRTARLLALGWVTMALVVWVRSPYDVLPTPMEVLRAFPALITEHGLLPNLITSFLVNAKSLAIAAVISLGLAYTSVVPAIRPVVTALANIRYWGFAGVTVLFTLMFEASHAIKVALLVFGITGFFLASMNDLVCSIPKHRFDYARTLGMSEWRVVWEVVVRGTLSDAWDIFRQNAAMGWMLLTMVEAIHRTEGGVGVMLASEQKHLAYANMAGVQLSIFLVGLAQDAVIGLLKHLTCPHAALAAERRES